MIDSYQFGAMSVKGKTHRNDLKIIGDQVIGDWWRIEGHAVHEADIADILSASVEILVVGTGDPGRMQISRGAAQALERLEIRVLAFPTRQAVGIFNALRAEGKRVAGAFHLTC
jgi:hypothetical protein